MAGEGIVTTSLAERRGRPAVQRETFSFGMMVRWFGAGRRQDNTTTNHANRIKRHSNEFVLRATEERAANTQQSAEREG
jgi:hypothetical protein